MAKRSKPMTPAEARLVEAAIKEHKQGNILHIKWATVIETDWDDFKLALAEYKRAVAAVVKERRK